MSASTRDREIGLPGPDAPVRIRAESVGDIEAITMVIDDAFRSAAHAAGDEALRVLALRRQGALSVSLVAEEAGRIVGHIAFSPAHDEGGSDAEGGAGWYALGPVAVWPALHGRGIGAGLIRAGLDDLARLGARGCILLGNPKFYARFGFVLAPDAAPASVPKAYFMLKLILGEPPRAPLDFHPALLGRGA